MNKCMHCYDGKHGGGTHTAPHEELYEDGEYGIWDVDAPGAGRYIIFTDN